MRLVQVGVVIGMVALVAGMAGVVALDAAPVPAVLPGLPVGEGAPLTPERVGLGRLLFFDPLLSRDERLACASCHDPAHGFADPRGSSRGVTRKLLPRNTPSVANLAFTQALFRDGRAGSLEEQLLEPLTAPDEMGADVSVVLRKLAANERYREMFDRAFPGSGITVANFVRAIAAYERTLVTRDTAYDRWAAGETDALTPEARRGWKLFNGRARCAVCHPAPLFGSDDLDPIGTPDRDASGNLCKGADPGLAGITGNADHFGAFRAPSLRNVASTAPYMHNGVFATLEEVIDFYDEGGGRGLGLAVENQDEDVVPLALTDREKADLLAFLEALTQSGPLDRTPAAVPSGLTPGGSR